MVEEPNAASKPPREPVDNDIPPWKRSPFARYLGAFLRQTDPKESWKQEFLAILSEKKPRYIASIDKHVDDPRFPLFWYDPVRREPAYPKVWAQLCDHLEGLGEPLTERFWELARKFWDEFERAQLTPEQRAAKDKARRDTERAERKQQKQADERLLLVDNEADWRLMAPDALNEPAPLRDLVAGIRQLEVPAEQMAIRNQVSGREFLHEVLGLKDRDIRAERFRVASVLKSVPGWTRVQGVQSHRGEAAHVYRRDGTDGRPTIILLEPKPARRRIV